MSFWSIVSYVQTISTIESLPTGANESALETPQDNIVHGFSSLPKVTSIMLDDLEKILVE